METRANYVIVGVFTMLALVAAFAFIYWTAAIGDRGDLATLRIRIPGSASGLGRGSLVLFNGVKIGDVQRVYIDVSNPSAAVADARVDRSAPITQSTTADVGIAGLTGQANIELGGGVVGEKNLFDLADQTGQVATLIARPSAVTNILQTAQSLLTRADSVLDELEGFVKETRGPLAQTVRNTEEFTAALSRNSSGIDKFLASVSELSDTITSVSGQLDTTLKSANDLLAAVDRDKVAQVVDNVQGFTQRLDEASGRLEGIVNGVDTAVASINTFTDSANQALAKVDGVIDGIDPSAVRTALTNFQQASTTVNSAVNDIAKVAAKVGERADDIDQTIASAKQLAERLNQASARVDGVLAKVDNLLGSGEAEGVMADASETLKAFKQVADTLNGRMGTITDGLARFSGQGLRDFEALIRDGRRSITRIEQAVSDIERNPQRIITGGDGTVRQYDGRTRR